MEPKISVLVPAYNVAPWLPSCLDSILAQTYQNLEIIVVNDGSTDNTGTILDSYAKKNGRIVAIHQKNAGLVAARETGIAHATGDYVTFVDGDDTIAPDMYEHLMANALKYKADISHCGMDFVFPDGHIEPHYGTGRLLVQDNIEGLRELLIGELVEPSLCTKLYARYLVTNSCLDKSVLNNEDLLRNFTLFSRANRIVFEDFCGYQYFQRPGSMSKDSSKALQNLKHILRARKLIVDNSSEELYPYAMRLWLSTYINAINQKSDDCDEQMEEFCKECRQVLIREKKNIRHLIKRQQIAAWLIIYAPWLHKIIYRIYKRRR